VLPIYLHDRIDRVRVLFGLLKKHCAETSVLTLSHLYATNKHLDLIWVFSEVLAVDCDLGADIRDGGGKDRIYTKKPHVLVASSDRNTGHVEGSVVAGTLHSDFEILIAINYCVHRPQ
jgi:hypothetical protein